ARDPPRRPPRRAHPAQALQCLPRPRGRRPDADRHVDRGLGAGDPRRREGARAAHPPHRDHPRARRPLRVARRAAQVPAGRRGARQRPRRPPAAQRPRLRTGGARGPALPAALPPARQDPADPHDRRGRPRRLARGRLRARPHAGPARLPRHARPDADLRRRLPGAGRPVRHDPARQALPGPGAARHLAPPDRQRHRPQAPRARPEPPGDGPRAGGREPGRRDGPRDPGGAGRL
ncbi:MAG: Uncharacterized protein YobT, partial [uncultured Solirubrobacteraceae bacterium]